MLPTHYSLNNEFMLILKQVVVLPQRICVAANMVELVISHVAYTSTE